MAVTLMLWYAELLLEFLLIIRLTFARNGRPFFEGLIATDFLIQLFQMFGQRVHWFGLGAHIWYVGVLIEIPLMAMALEEASDYRPLWHRKGLFWWISIVFGCAWIRVFPYTGTALLMINSLYFFICLFWFEVE